jgi:hypothetical protein
VAAAVLGIALAMLPAVCSAQACDKVGAGTILVCKVVGTRCSPPTNGVCATVVSGRNDSDCLCVVQPPGGLHADLLPVGNLPSARGAAYFDNIMGELLIAIGAEGLIPLATYRALNHASGDCFDGAGAIIGLPFQANSQGMAGIIGDVVGPTMISIQDLGGVPVLCGSMSPIAATAFTFAGLKVLYR